MRLLALCCLALLGGFSAKGQGCGFDPTPEQQAAVAQLLAGRAVSRTEAGDALVTIPLKFHLVRRSDGTGGITASQVEGILAQLNTYYEPANMRFSQFGELNFIDNDDLYNFDAAREDQAATGNDVRNVVNLYFFNSIRSGGSPLCGYTRFPPSTDRVILAYGCVLGGNTTLEHELGHYFTLYHTHGKTNTGTTDELVDGSNCTVAGDDICDTPADPNLTGRVQNCQYIGSARDANGQSYRPDPSNIMAYAPDQCQNKFTDGQYARIRNGFETGRNYLNFTADGFTATFAASTQEQCVGRTIAFQAISFGATSFQWEFEGGTPATSTEANPVVRYDQGGSFSVTLRARSAGGEEREVRRNRMITIIDPLGQAVDDSLVSAIDAALPEGMELENPDRGYTFGFADSVDRDGNASSGSIMMPHFDYFSESTGNIDYLYFPYQSFEGARGFLLTFDYAYAPKEGRVEDDNIIPDIYDSLMLGVETACADVPRFVWMPTGTELATVPPQGGAFRPTASQWKQASIFVERETGDEFARIFFRSVSMNGNNLYLDNLALMPDYTVETPTNFRKASADAVSVTLRWVNPSPNALGFRLERSVNGGAFAEVAMLPGNVLSYQDTNVASGEEYTYRLYSFSKFENRSGYTPDVVVSDFKVTALEENAIPGLLVYPNPASEAVQLRMGNLQSGVVAWVLHSIDGKTVAQGQAVKAAEQFEQRIALPRAKPGIYFLEVSLDGRRTVRKLVVE
jgi:PKD repeat protein